MLNIVESYDYFSGNKCIRHQIRDNLMRSLCNIDIFRLKSVDIIRLTHPGLSDCIEHN